MNIFYRHAIYDPHTCLFGDRFENKNKILQRLAEYVQEFPADASWPLSVVLYSAIRFVFKNNFFRATIQYDNKLLNVKLQKNVFVLSAFGQWETKNLDKCTRTYNLYRNACYFQK